MLKILGFLSSRSLGDRRDLVDLLMSCVMQQQNPAAPTGYSELRPFAATSLGRVVTGQPDILLPHLLKAIQEATTASATAFAASAAQQPSASSSKRQQQQQRANNEQQLIVFYLLQALREVSSSFYASPSQLVVSTVIGSRKGPVGDWLISGGGGGFVDVLWRRGAIG